MSTEQPSFASILKATRVTPGTKIDLSDWPTRSEELFAKKADAESSVDADAHAIDELQDCLYAEGSRALLVILQGMDTAGKSGTIKSVFQATSPMGMMVKAFKAPTKDELARDFLWRVHAAVPPKGFIGIFDRSQYEDVLVVKVRALAPAAEIERRYDQINAFEKLLSQTGTKVLKVMLHLGYKEQGERLCDRLEKPHKRWKFNPRDLSDRRYWDGFQDAYETMVERCSTEHAPWHIVPADSKSRRNAIIARLVRGTLEEMDPKHPDSQYRLKDFPELKER